MWERLASVSVILRTLQTTRTLQTSCWVHKVDEPLLRIVLGLELTYNVLFLGSSKQSTLH